MMKLTPTQARALEFIRAQVASNGVAPTLREICTYMGYKAIGSAQDLVTALRKKGFLVEQDRQVARAFVPTELAQVHAGELGLRVAGGELPPEPAELLRSPAVSARGSLVHVSSEQDAELCVVPCLGAVPAGSPIEAVEEHIGSLGFSRSLLPKPYPRPEELFALRARGDSMMGAGILDGDWLVVRVAREAQSGAIVVARVDGDVTVKRLVLDRTEGWSLVPENPRFQPIMAAAQPFELVGQVVALQRSLN